MKRPGWNIADAIDEGLDVAKFLAECPRLEVPKEEAESAPFRCLGYDTEHYWFLLGAQRQPFAISKGGFNSSKLGELAPLRWWASEKAVTDDGGIAVPKAQQLVIALENARGMFDSGRLRGAGVWLEDDEIVINDGGRIVLPGGETRALEDFSGEGEYVRSSVHFGDMTGDGASAEEGRELVELIEAQRFTRKIDAVAVLGWSLISPFGGLLKFRPHLWLSGRKGSGKTFVLENIIREIAGPFAHCGSGKDTEAGIRRTLNQDARPVILDEMEPKGKARENVRKILDLARNASSDGSGRVTMANGSTGTLSFLIRSCFCFASINTDIEEGAAIASRIISAELESPKDTSDEAEKIKRSRELYGVAMHDPERYRRRMFRALPRVLGDIAFLRDELPKVLGASRDADLWAPIYAAAWAVQSDESIKAASGIAWLWETVKETVGSRETMPEDEDRVIEHILEAQIESDEHKRRTVAEWLTLSQGSTTEGDFALAAGLLERYGLRILEPRSLGRKVLAIACRSDALSKILEKTIYEGGYDAQIRRNRLCLTKETPQPERMGGKLAPCRLLDWEGFKRAYMGQGEE